MTVTTTIDAPTQELRERLYAFILSRVRSPEIADDFDAGNATQSRKALSQSRVRNIEGWLFTIARNTVADYFRGSRDHVEWDEHAHGEITNEGAVTREEADLREQLAAYVRCVVENLREPYREALLLTDEGLSQIELAQRLDTSLTCAKSRVQRARTKVKRTIERCCRITTDAYGQVTDCERREPVNCDC